MKRAKAEAARWLAQAESDLGFAELGLREGFFAQACFVCQQAVEKALKALHYLGGARAVLGHSVVERCARVRSRRRVPRVHPGHPIGRGRVRLAGGRCGGRSGTAPSAS